MTVELVYQEKRQIHRRQPRRRHCRRHQVHDGGPAPTAN